MVRTLPTTGPLFGSFKLQIDYFSVPVRLYQASLHMNLLNIGMDMKNVLLPIMDVRAKNPVRDVIRRGKFNQSSIMSYLGLRGGMETIEGTTVVNMRRNSLALLAYYDVFKNYYANKQEKKAYYIMPKIAGMNVVTSMLS